jgi:hypothetical protein
MKRPALALLACLLFASISLAQQSDANAPASKADVERFLDAMQTRDMMKNMMAVMQTQMRRIVHQQMQKQTNLPADAEERLNKTTDDMLKTFPYDEFIEAIIPVYQKHLTKGDVDALVTFYSSPTGAKMLKDMPPMTESMQAASGVMQKMMADATRRVNDEIAQMQKTDDGKLNKPSAPASK